MKSKLVHLLIHAGMQWFDRGVAVGLRQVDLIISVSVDSVAKTSSDRQFSLKESPGDGKTAAIQLIALYSCDEQKCVFKGTRR